MTHRRAAIFRSGHVVAHPGSARVEKHAGEAGRPRSFSAASMLEAKTMSVSTETVEAVNPTLKPTPIYPSPMGFVK